MSAGDVREQRVPGNLNSSPQIVGEGTALCVPDAACNALSGHFLGSAVMFAISTSRSGFLPRPDQGEGWGEGGCPLDTYND